MNTRGSSMPAALARLGTILLLAGIMTGGSLGRPSPAPAQVRPEVGGTVSLITGPGGDAFSGFEDAIGLGVEVGAEVGSGWRVSAGGEWSDHDRQTALRVPGDLWRFSARIRHSLPIPETRLRPFLGVRGGAVAVDYDTSVLAVIEVDFLPGTRVNPSDEGVLVGPELGVRVSLGDRWVGELRGAYEFANVDPVIVAPDEEPGWSHSAAVSAVLLFRP